MTQDHRHQWEAHPWIILGSLHLAMEAQADIMTTSHSMVGIHHKMHIHQDTEGRVQRLFHTAISRRAIRLVQASPADIQELDLVTPMALQDMGILAIQVFKVQGLVFQDTMVRRDMALQDTGLAQVPAMEDFHPTVRPDMARQVPAREDGHQNAERSAKIQKRI